MRWILALGCAWLLAHCMSLEGFTGAPVEDAGDARDSGSDISTPDAVPIDADAGDAGDAGDARRILFEDDFDGGLSRWTIRRGAWSTQNGEAIQGDAATSVAEMFVTGMEAQTDYRVVARMRRTAGPFGAAMEIAFRVDPTTDAEWHCNWEPEPDTEGKAFLRLQEEGNGPAANRSVGVAGISGYSPGSWFTMEVSVVSTNVLCTIREVMGASVSLTGAILRTRGSFGLRTYLMTAAFDSFEVFPAP